jgi:hypothetical protein
MEAPPELRSLMRMDMEQVCLLKGNAYGRVDAPLLFYKEFRKRLEEVGFQAHPLDNCLFLLRDPRDPHKLDGILGTHVDDGIGGVTKILRSLWKNYKRLYLLVHENMESSNSPDLTLNNYRTSP